MTLIVMVVIAGYNGHLAYQLMCLGEWWWYPLMAGVTIAVVG